MASIIPWGIRAVRAYTQYKALRSARTAVKNVIRAISRRPASKRAKLKSLPTAKIVRSMPFYRRRFNRRKPVYRRKRFVRKTANKIHTFVRWCDKDTTFGASGPNTISETGSDQHLAYVFKLDNVSAVGDFTALYDGYKINKVQLTLEPTIDQTINLAQGLCKKITVVHDYNDANPLSGEDDYLQYSNCKRYFPWSRRGIKITLYPKINNVIENVSGAANGFTSMNSNRQFLNIATDEVPHFGIKMLIPAGLTNVTDPPTQLFRVRCKMWLSMRGSK